MAGSDQSLDDLHDGNELNDSAYSAEALGVSYVALLEQQTWELNVEDGAIQAAATLEPPATAAPPSVVRIVEALLFVGGPPLTASRACEVIRGLTPVQFAEALAQLNHDYRQQGRPYLILPQGQGHVLALRPSFRPVLEKLYGAMREARLSPVVIDVLALVAYRQPVTKQEIDSIRGADSGHLLRQLLRRGLVAIVHRAEAAQREVLYGTTSRFLELFQLSSLDDLPQTQDLQRL